MVGERLLEAYPLTWPLTTKRASCRSAGPFQVSLFTASEHLRNELKLLPAINVVVSSNVQTRRDGLPYADAREPDDPGVAVYFDRRVYEGATLTVKPYVIACDTYRKVRANVRAIGLTVEALRAISRHGASSMLEQAFTGFLALPPAGRVEPWWEVLGVAADASETTVRDAFRELARIHHPDVGGDGERMARINEAFARAQRRAS